VGLCGTQAKVAKVASRVSSGYVAAVYGESGKG